MSDESDIETSRQQKRKRKARYVIDDEDEDSTSDSSIEKTLHMKRVKARKQNCIKDSDSDSDSSIEVLRRKRRVGRVNSDSSNTSNTSASSIVVVRRDRRAPRAISESSTEDGGFEGSSDGSQWETDFSDNDHARPQQSKGAISSDSSDDQAEKCPICLLTFKQQEIGTPESCDHTFCADCIQEWAKNVNTCPVDRQPFSLILVRKCANGKVVRQIPVEPPTQQEEVEENLTVCEVCGLGDREDSLLLCDGCDLAFHLDCLNPPLPAVPPGAWYCDVCENDELFQQVQIMMLGDVLDGWPNSSNGRANHPRLLPRTRQSERVRQRVQRQRRNNNREENQPSVSSGIEDSNQAGPSTSNLATETSRRTTRKRKTRKRRKRKTYRTVYKIDETTGETIAVREKIKRRSNRKRNRRLRMAVAQQKTVKRRLASQLGNCRPRSNVQFVPDVKVVGSSSGISHQRYQAGIPTLHLFGQQDELDYFSGSDIEFGGSGMLFSRRPNRSDVNALRNQIRRKTISMPSAIVTSSDDLLGTILESQAKLHSKNSVLSLSEDGSLKVDTKERVNINNNNSVRYRQTPMQPNSANDRNGRDITNSFSTDRNSTYNNFTSTVTPGSSSVIRSTSENSDFEQPHDYSQNAACEPYYNEEKEKKDKNGKSDETKNCDSVSGDNTPRSTASVHSDSELDIYSDIETVSTSKIDEQDQKPVTPVLLPAASATGTDDENNDSDAELVIDTEKVDSDKYDPTAPIDSEESSKEEMVSSTVDTSFVSTNNQPVVSAAAHSTSELQSERVQSSNEMKDDRFKNKDQEEGCDDDDEEDGCPNFSIYSTESINLAKTTDLELLSENNVEMKNGEECSEVTSTPTATEEKTTDAANLNEPENVQLAKKSTSSNSNALYSDSEDDIKIEVPKTFGIGDIQNMTEDISEEERSYTPCLDEKAKSYQEGLDGLDTEMISDEDRNDFDESHDLKTASDGDALEINVKDSEMDFTKAEDYEEGEIVDKLKIKKQETAKKDEEEKPEEKKVARKEKQQDDKNKENESKSKDTSFKKLSKSNKERNYRDKDKERSRSRSKEKKEKSGKENKKDKRKEKRKEIERYDVRTIIAEKPRRLKDKFGRDVSKRSLSPSSRSPSPYRSRSRSRRSVSRSRKRRDRSRNRRSYSRSRSPDRRYSRSVERRRSKSRNRKRKRSSSYDEEKAKRRSRDRSRGKTRKARSRSRHRSSRSASPRRRRDWEKKHSRDWTPSLSRSRSPDAMRHMSPSWTPPHLVDKAVKPHNLTVILTNDSGKKKKEKKKKTEKKNKEPVEKKKKRRNKTPPPSKEVFASGDNILVSVSFNKDNEKRDVTTKRKKDLSISENLPPKKPKKAKTPTNKTKKVRDLSGVKPVAIIDLDRSPFKELTPSPKDIIVLSDSDNGENNEMMGIQKAVCDSSQHVASPEGPANNNYTMGPKTPPEPQIKFALNPKPQQLRPITNPLHEEDEVENEIDGQEESNQRPPEVTHKGPNTPPDPPNSPPSSPDAYDPFDPTKSRSPTPEPVQTNTQSNSISVDNSRSDSRLELRPAELTDKANTPTRQTTPDVSKSHTPPLLETQPDSQSSILTNTPDNRPTSPDVSITAVVQSQNSIFPNITVKPVASTVPYSSTSAPPLITSTPVSSASRINILSSTILTPPHVVSSVQQRIVLPNKVKSSPVKAPIKSTPIKPMPTKNVLNKAKQQTPIRKTASNEVINLDFDSPYSPGSSDYEDLFEPPPDVGVVKPTTAKAGPQKTTKSPVKAQSAFDSLFGSSPVYNINKNKASKNDKGNKASKKNLPTAVKGTKQIGVKLDEDNLKILDELPNSAVEMQVKDKFLKKLNRQERVVEEVKLVLKPHYNKKHINKEEYKDILRRAVPKICHNRSGEINPKKIQNLIEAYVKKVRHSKKVTSSSSVNPQKV